MRLAELLDEAEERAFKVVSEKNAELPEANVRGSPSDRDMGRLYGQGDKHNG